MEREIPGKIICVVMQLSLILPWLFSPSPSSFLCPWVLSGESPPPCAVTLTLAQANKTHLIPHLISWAPAFGEKAGGTARGGFWSTSILQGAQEQNVVIVTPKSPGISSFCAAVFCLFFFSESPKEMGWVLTTTATPLPQDCIQDKFLASLWREAHNKTCQAIVAQQGLCHREWAPPPKKRTFRVHFLPHPEILCPKPEIRLVKRPEKIPITRNIWATSFRTSPTSSAAFLKGRKVKQKHSRSAVSPFTHLPEDNWSIFRKGNKSHRHTT